MRLLIDRFWDKVNRLGPVPNHVHWLGRCWVWTASAPNGYGRIGAGGAGGKILIASRFSWNLANGTIPDGLCVLHKCDNSLCVRPSHLFLGTKRENNHDCIRKKRNKPHWKPGTQKGELNVKAKLTEQQVKEIKRELKSGYRVATKLANKYGVCRQAIDDIKNGKNWSHVSI